VLQVVLLLEFRVFPQSSDEISITCDVAQGGDLCDVGRRYGPIVELEHFDTTKNVLVVETQSPERLACGIDD